MLEDGWCLVLAVWGQKYSDDYVNVMVESARRHSPSFSRAVLFTDCVRAGISADIEQRILPDFFAQEKFRGHGYIVKLSIFSRADLPIRTRCVYLDLDTVVVGDLGKVAALVTTENDYFMLPPGNLIGFGRIRRLLYRMSRGGRFATGNSSILAYCSGAEPNLCDTFQTLYETGEGRARHMTIDDVFISWFAQPTLGKIPQTLGVTFRREFLSKSAILLWCKSRLPLIRHRREGLAAITFNGVAYKPDALLRLAEGERIVDARGRFGYWSAACLGSAKAKIVEYCERVGGG